jgi:hypothetical protein
MQTKACLLFLFSIVSLVVNAQQDWHIYEANDIDFSVLLPEKPNVKVKELNTEIGKVITNNYSVSLDKKSNNFLYTINTVQFPKATFSKDSTSYNDEVMQSHLQELSTTLKCKLVYQNPVTISDENGYIFRLTDDRSGQVVKGCITLYNDKIYTITVFTLLDRSLNSDIDRFLNSFKLKK